MKVDNSGVREYTIKAAKDRFLYAFFLLHFFVLLCILKGVFGGNTRMNIKNKGLWTVVALVIAGLTIRAVFNMSGEMSFSGILEAVRNAHPGWMALAVVCMIGIIYFEGEAVRVILKGIGYEKNRFQGFVYGAADVYFSAITPSASGGQPASAFFMIKDGVSMSIATAVLILNLVMYTLAIVSISIVCIIWDPQPFFLFQTPGKILIVLGFLALSGLSVLFYMLLRHQRFLFGTARRLIRLLDGHHLLRHPKKKLEKLKKAENEYRECVLLMKGHMMMLIKAYLNNLLQRLSQFFAILSVYMATGGEAGMLPKLFTTQCYIILGSNCVPVPGGMGITDYLMLDGYGQLFDRTYSYRLEMLGRGMTFYCCVLISAVTVLLAYVLLSRKEKNLRKQRESGSGRNMDREGKASISSRNAHF